MNKQAGSKNQKPTYYLKYTISYYFVLFHIYHFYKIIYVQQSKDGWQNAAGGPWPGPDGDISYGDNQMVI